MTSQIITASGEHRAVSPANGKTWQLEELQTIVGGLIEVIGVSNPEWPYDTMVINEEGKLYELPMNKDATAIADLYMNDYVVGDVLLCNTDDEGNMV